MSEGMKLKVRKSCLISALAKVIVYNIRVATPMFPVKALFYNFTVKRNCSVAGETFQFLFES